MLRRQQLQQPREHPVVHKAASAAEIESIIPSDSGFSRREKTIVFLDCGFATEQACGGKAALAAEIKLSPS